MSVALRSPSHRRTIAVEDHDPLDGSPLMNKCKKCGRSLNDCTACNGGRASGMFGKLTCSKCNNTGVVCNTHGGHWK